MMAVRTLIGIFFLTLNTRRRLGIALTIVMEASRESLFFYLQINVSEKGKHSNSEGAFMKNSI